MSDPLATIRGLPAARSTKAALIAATTRGFKTAKVHFTSGEEESFSIEMVLDDGFVGARKGINNKASIVMFNAITYLEFD